MARTRLQSPYRDEIVLDFDHPQVTATTEWKMFQVPAGKTLKVTKAEYINPTGLAEDPTNYFAIGLQQAAVVVAGPYSTDSDGAGTNTLAADTWTTLTLSATAADLLIEAGESLKLVATEGGTATLPAGRIVVHGQYI